MEKQYYWKLLFDVTALEKEQFSHGIAVQAETLNLKGLAFCGLIRLGESFQIESNAEEIEKLKAQQQKRIISSNDIKIPDLVETIKIRNMDNTVYSLDLKFFKKMLKSDYDKLITKKNQQPVQAAYEELDIDLPDIFSEVDTLPEQAEAKPQKEIEKKPAPAPSIENIRTELYVPELVGDIRYNRDPQNIKGLDTFCMNQVRLVYEEGDKHAVVDFNIFPLTFSEDEPVTDIMVVALSGSIIRAGISRGTSAAVKIEFDELSFIARGQWKEGDFKTQVNCLTPAFANKFMQDTKEIMPINRTYTTYMQEEIDHTTYSFFPAIIGHNGNSGNVPTAMVFQQNDALQILLSNEKDTFNMTDSDGFPYEVALYWSGGQTPQLRLQIDEE